MEHAEAWTTNGRPAGSALIAELIVALAILVIVVGPLSLLFVKDARLVRAEYCRAVAMEIVDGEMEILAAGEWRAFPEGTHTYEVRADVRSATGQLLSSSCTGGHA